MASKRKANGAQAARAERSIRLVAIMVILVVIGAVVWGRLPKKEVQHGAACGAFDSIPAADQYPAPPPVLIDTAAKYFAHIEMEKGGEIVLELYADKAPVTVNSFVFLSCKGFYDGVTFHRVIDGFMAQGGDPTGGGSGGPGYEYQNEDNDLQFGKPGVVAMANAGRDTNGSQFFITYAANYSLNGGYTIFGQLTSGMDVADGLTRRDPRQSPDYEGDRIRTITVSVGE